MAIFSSSSQTATYFLFDFLTFYTSLQSPPLPDTSPLISFPSFLHPKSSLPPPLTSILFPLLREILASPLGSSWLFNFAGSLDYSMFFLYFMAYIQLKVSTHHACPFGSGLPHSGYFWFYPFACLIHVCLVFNS